jgi:NAD(P)-dependent dehydrogenase (short-subunit alcohol dehydrogenase family)
MDTFIGRVAVVTGAASGIGLALARRCAAEGMRVVLADVEAAPLAAAAEALTASGAELLAQRCDVSDPASVDALAVATQERFGAVHLLFNNAGVSAAGPVWEAPLAEWNWVMGVNVMGVVHGLRAFVPIMLRQEGEGHIINTASMAGLVAGAGMGVYNASKSAVVAISETLQRDLTDVNARIGVSVLCPGWVQSRIVASGRNRPFDVSSSPVPDPRTRALTQQIRAWVDAGLPAEEVAGIVFDAIRQRRFYILTHPTWKRMVEKRMRGILDS